LCNHADFLGVMSPAEMRSTFFIADSRGEFMRYRLKGHAVEDYWNWMSSWAVSITKPSDIGFEDGAFKLAKLMRCLLHHYSTVGLSSDRAACVETTLTDAVVVAEPANPVATMVTIFVPVAAGV
jgi:hypothetical protein